MSKGAVEQAVRVLCKALGPKGIRVKACGPGPTATELFLAVRRSIPSNSPDLTDPFAQPETQQEIDAYAKMAALGRLGTPEDIAKVRFVSSASSQPSSLHETGRRFPRERRIRLGQRSNVAYKRYVLARL